VKAYIILLAVAGFIASALMAHLAYTSGSPFDHFYLSGNADPNGRGVGSAGISFNIVWFLFGGGAVGIAIGCYIVLSWMVWPWLLPSKLREKIIHLLCSKSF